jgi:hypothetical protein
MKSKKIALAVLSIVLMLGSVWGWAYAAHVFGPDHWTGVPLSITCAMLFLAGIVCAAEAV